MKSFALALLCSSLLVGCRVVYDSELAVPENNPLHIPALQGEVNEVDSMFKIVARGNRKAPYNDSRISYGDTLISGTIEVFQTSGHHVLLEIDTTEKIFIPEERVFDNIKIFASELNNNINDDDTVKRGTIELKLLAFREKRNPLMMFFSVCTFFVPSLVGVPVTSIRTKIQVQVLIKDMYGNLVKSYTAFGKGRSFIALYWGYGGDAWRKSNILAFKEAMTSVKEQMRYDRRFLVERLSGQ